MPAATIARPRAAAAGVLAAGAGLAAAELVGGLLQVRQTPVVAVGSAFIDVVPGWLKDVAIELFGTADKAVLIGGILLVLAAVAAAAGILAAHRLWWGLAVVTAIAVLGLVTVLIRPDAAGRDVATAVVAGLVALALLSPLLRWLGPTARPSGTDQTDRAESVPARRALLTGAAVAVTSLLAAMLGRRVGRPAGQVAEARDGLDLPPSVGNAPIPKGADLNVDGISRWRTPNGTFYRIDTALSVPQVDPDTWRLRIHGMVAREVEVSLHQLLRRRIVDRWVTLACVSNEVGGDLVGNALWTGVPVRELLDEARPHPEADAVRSVSADGWNCGTPLAALTDGRDALLAVAMNGEPLPVEHGFPARLVVPGLYGFVSATKWVTEIEVTRFDRFSAYWTERGWSERAPIKTASRIDVPSDGATVRAGRVAVAGVAWAQDRGIRDVQVRIDDGPWQRARLAEEPTIQSWRQWSFAWNATTGSHRLQVRATDGTGRLQTSTTATPAPNGASGWHGITVDVD